MKEKEETDNLVFVRSSAKKYIKAKSVLESEIKQVRVPTPPLPEDEENEDDKKKKKKTGPKKKKVIEDPHNAPTKNTAVEYVKMQRKKNGLPEDVNEEIAVIEEKYATKELTKGGSVESELDKYLDTQTFEHRLVTNIWAQRVAKEMMAWVDKPFPPDRPPIKITEFFREVGIWHRDFYRLKKKFEVLDIALEYCLQKLGDIRERYVLENKFNPTAGMYMMGYYDKDWMAEQKRREDAKLKQTQAQAVDIKALFMEMTKPVGSTQEVKNKLEEDKKRRLESETEKK